LLILQTGRIEGFAKGHTMTSTPLSPNKLRLALMTSVCLGGLTAVPAAAQQTVSASGTVAGSIDLRDLVDAPMSGATTGIVQITDLVDAPMSGAPASTINITEAVESPQITIRNDIPAGQFFDPTNVTGIGQIITDSGGGFIGTCTGSLINPRTVLFAAHCVNTRAATAYGTGGVLAGVGFETNTRANAAGQVDELVNWLLGSGAGPGRGITNTAQSFYNLNQVRYDPRSLAPASCTGPTSCFLEADIATGILDTPAAGIPTWALLFSPLDKPATISTSAGTGYHVNIFGYGNTGNGTTGASTSGGFRRRAAENMLGALVSLNDRNLFLFGTTGTPSRPQPLYFLDFDDPTRTNPRDFNSFRDNALPREGTTGPGDSGGPLVLDRQFSKQVVIGVLSGGSTFFGGQPGGSYGTQSFYQPLFLYWDWIAANNPYRYVTATAGNKNWEDATAWITELDPNYNIIVNGQLVNGIPTNPGAANAPGSTVQFGEQCFQLGATNECQNIATGAIRNNVPNGAGDPVNNAGVERIAANGDVMSATETAQNNGFLTTPRPAPTIANGLPGATGFTPNNVDGVRTTGALGRYYDVTLRNTGVVTLNSTVTVDRFAISGATSQLNIAAGASLTSLIDVRHNTGTISNNGTLVSRGDYLLMSGLLTGTGTVRAPFLTSVLGTIAPGTMGTIGNLGVAGNLILSSGSSLMIDLGLGGGSDRVVVTANGTSTGSANLGGGVFFSPVAGYRPTWSDSFTILTATGGVTGTFNTPAPFSAILSPRLTYSANAVTMNIIAANYRDVIAPASPIQSAFAQLLDQNRAGNFRALSGVYGELDLLSQAGVRANLEALAPNHVPIRNDIGYASTEILSSFVRDRIGRVAGGDMGGTVAMYGRPLQLASLALNAQDGSDVRTDAGAPMAVRNGEVAENTSVFFAGGYVDGRGSGLPTATPGGRSDFDGFYLAAGSEVAFEDDSFVGFAAGYTDLDGSARASRAAATGRLFQSSLYGAKMFDGGFAIDGHASVGALKTTTARVVPVGGTTQTLRSSDKSSTFAIETGVSYQAGSDVFAVTPRASVRYASIAFGQSAETGGTAALRNDLGRFNSLQGRLGLSAKSKKGMVRPYFSANFVHEFKPRDDVFGSNFAAGIGADAIFALPSTDRNWFEAGAGLTVDSDNVSLSVGGESTVGRSDLKTLSGRVAVSIRF
jgi:uncharacterized protein YhjY with autotransporter beta-barrel domain